MGAGTVGAPSLPKYSLDPSAIVAVKVIEYGELAGVPPVTCAGKLAFVAGAFTNLLVSANKTFEVFTYPEY